MTTETTRRPLRTAVVTLALALATSVGFSAGAAADVLTPLEEVGAPGGGGGFGGQYDDMLAGSGYESAATQASAPTVAEVRSAEIAGASSSQDDVLAGSGYEGATTVAQHPTQNAQSIDRVESTQTATGALAGGETQSPQALGNHATAF